MLLPVDIEFRLPAVFPAGEGGGEGEKEGRKQLDLKRIEARLGQIIGDDGIIDGPVKGLKPGGSQAEIIVRPGAGDIGFGPVIGD